MKTASASLRGRDLISPMIAALISVIVNYGVHLFLCFKLQKWLV